MNSSSSSNLSTYSSNPFEHKSFQDKSESNSLSFFEIAGFFEKNTSDKNTNQTPQNFILTLNVEYKKPLNEVIINEVKIDNQGNKIEQLFNIPNEDITDINRAKFFNFLKIVKSKFKSDYKRKEKIEIDLKFEFNGFDNDINNITCLYEIKNAQLGEDKFNDYDILNNFDYNGLNFMLENLNE